MGKNKYTQEEKEKALDILKQWRGHTLLAIVNSVSRSGMTRRIEFYAAEGNETTRIGYFMSKILEWPYDVDKGGFQVFGCGMDMIFYTIYSFNHCAYRVENPEKDYTTPDSGYNYFFPTIYKT